MPMSQGAQFFISGGHPPTVDFSTYIESISLSTGRMKMDPKIYAAPAGKCTLVVRNETLAFTPSNSSGSFYPYLGQRQAVKVFVGASGGSSHTCFCGYITRIAPLSGVRSARNCVIELTDLIGLLSTAKPRIPLLKNRPANHGVAAVINTALGANYAYMTVTFTGVPSGTDGISLFDASGASCAWNFTAGSPTANQIKATTTTDAATNLAAMINQTTGVGTLYGTVLNQAYPDGMIASAVGNVCTITASIPGATGATFAVQKVGTTITLTNSSSVVSNPVTATSVDLPVAGSNGWMEGNITYDIGITILPYIGVGWDNVNTANGPTALAMIEELTRNENGMFYEQQGGGVFWRNRNYKFKILPTASVDTFTGQPDAIGEAADTDVYNDIRVTVTPKDLLVAGVVAKSSSAVAVPGKGNKTIHLPFTDPTTGQRMGATALTLPLVGHTDYYATEQSNRTGVDYSTGNLAQYLTHTYVVTGAGIDITFINTATGTLYITGLQVRGTGIVSYNPSANLGGSFSVSANTLPIDMSLSNDTNYSASMANYFYNRYSNWIYRIKTLDFKNQNTLNGADTTRFKTTDILTLTDAQAGETAARYWIIGMKLDLNKAAGTLTCSYAVEKLDDKTYWLLGDATYGVLGTSTRLAI